MASRLPIVAGLLSGSIVAAAALAAVVAFSPERGTGGAGPSASPAHSGSAGPAPSAPVGSAGPSGLPFSAVPPASSPAASVTIMHLGEKAPVLVVPQVGGGFIDLATLRGKPVWVNFMASWCPSCVDEFPLMNGFLARYGPAGLVIMAIDVKEDEGTAAAFARRLGARFPVGLDLDGHAQRDWAVLALPVHFWVDRTGVIRDAALGGVGPDLMARGLGRILPEVTVTP